MTLYLLIHNASNIIICTAIAFMWWSRCLLKARMWRLTVYVVNANMRKGALEPSKYVQCLYMIDTIFKFV